MSHSTDIFAGVHTRDKIRATHISATNIVGPGDQRGILVVVQGDWIRQGIGESILVALCLVSRRPMFLSQNSVKNLPPDH